MPKRQSENGHWLVLLDNKPIRLPSGATLHLRCESLANAIAEEWQSAGGRIGGEFSVDDVKLTGLAGTAQDRVAPNPAGLVNSLAAYAQSDVLCYRAESPSTLVALQHEQWQPWLDWAALHHAAPLHASPGITHHPQPVSSLAAIRHALSAQPIETLAALSVAIPALGSCVLGLALAEGLLNAESALALGELDALHQEQQWGADPDAAARRARLQEDLAACVSFIALAQC